jgi:hypothetical protein
MEVITKTNWVEDEHFIIQFKNLFVKHSFYFPIDKWIMIMEINKRKSNRFFQGVRQTDDWAIQVY